MEVFRAEGLSDVVEILQRVQSSEKEKLQLIVKSNILIHSAGKEEEIYQMKKWLALTSVCMYGRVLVWLIGFPKGKQHNYCKK